MTASSASLILPSATWSSPSWGSEWRDPSPQWSYQPSRSRREWMICGLKDLIKKSGPAGPSPSCRRQACQIPWCLCVSIYLESIQCVVIYINKIVREWNNQSLITFSLLPAPRLLFLSLPNIFLVQSGIVIPLFFVVVIAKYLSVRTTDWFTRNCWRCLWWRRFSGLESKLKWF